VTYLNCALTGPLPASSRERGMQALLQKSRPWRITALDFFSPLEHIRRLFAQLICGDAEGVALVPAVSYGMALARQNIRVERGQNLVVLQDDFPSTVYAMRRSAAEHGAELRVARAGPGCDWSAAVLESIDARTAAVAVPHCHWMDGALLDLEEIARTAKRAGAALIVDGTQSIGALPFSLERIPADFVMTACHKWLLGPYSATLLYAAPGYRGGAPLEDNWLNRRGSEDFSRLTDYQDAYRDGARRYDMGQASSFLLLPVLAESLAQVLRWGPANIARALRELTDLAAALGEEHGWRPVPAHLRAPHMTGLKLAGTAARAAAAGLAAQRIFVSLRGDSIRVAPHLYNERADIERLMRALRN